MRKKGFNINWIEIMMFVVAVRRAVCRFAYMQLRYARLIISAARKMDIFVWHWSWGCSRLLSSKPTESRGCVRLHRPSPSMAHLSALNLRKGSAESQTLAAWLTTVFSFSIFSLLSKVVACIEFGPQYSSFIYCYFVQVAPLSRIKSLIMPLDMEHQAIHALCTQTFSQCVAINVRSLHGHEHEHEHEYAIAFC